MLLLLLQDSELIITGAERCEGSAIESASSIGEEHSDMTTFKNVVSASAVDVGVVEEGDNEKADSSAESFTAR
jgi:hypothetical protein